MRTRQMINFIIYVAITVTAGVPAYEFVANFPTVMDVNHLAGFGAAVCALAGFLSPVQGGKIVHQLLACVLLAVAGFHGVLF